MTELTLLHSDRPKLIAIGLSDATELSIYLLLFCITLCVTKRNLRQAVIKHFGKSAFDPIAPRKAKIVCNFVLSECNRVNWTTVIKPTHILASQHNTGLSEIIS